MPPPAPDPTIQTSYVFRCGSGAEEKPRVIADPWLRTRESTHGSRTALGWRLCHVCDAPGGKTRPEKRPAITRRNVTYKGGKQSFYRAKQSRPTRSARANALYKCQRESLPHRDHSKSGHPHN